MASRTGWSSAEVRITTGCWQWTGGKDAYGYGAIYRDGKVAKAHRVSYEMHVGPIADGLVIDHLCRNPGCVRPLHLDPVEHGENTRRGLRKTQQTHCKWGHEFTPENTAQHTNGGRQCRKCNTKAGRAARHPKTPATQAAETQPNQGETHA
jgi:hypothetical protein